MGQIANHQSLVNSENTVFRIKSYMSWRFTEVVEGNKRVPYKVVEGKYRNI